MSANGIGYEDESNENLFLIDRYSNFFTKNSSFPLSQGSEKAGREKSPNRRILKNKIFAIKNFKKELLGS